MQPSLAKFFYDRSQAVCAVFVLLCLMTGNALIAAPSLRKQTAAQSSRREAQTLEPGKTVESELQAEQPHAYQLPLTSGQYLQLAVTFKDGASAFTLFGVDGVKLIEVDSPGASQRVETVALIAAKTGRHRLEVSASDKTTDSAAFAGRYSVTVEELRPATPEDHQRVEAYRRFREAEQLSAQKTTEATRQAVAKYEEALQIRRGAGDRYEEAVILASLCRDYHALGDSAKAFEACAQALAIFQTLGGGGWDGLFKQMNLMYALMGGKQKALDFLADALPLVRALRNPRLEAILLTGIGKCYEDLEDKPRALIQYQQALANYRALGRRPAGEMISLTEIADADLSLADKQKAIGYLNQALMITRAVGDKQMEATMLFGIGYLHSSMDERQKALEQFERALPIFRAAGDRNSEAYVFNFIGNFYAALGESLKALDRHEQALAIFRELKDLKAQGYTLQQIGGTFSRLGDAQRALEALGQAYSILRSAGERSGAAYAQAAIGIIRFDAGDSRRALTEFDAALAVLRAEGSRTGEAELLVNSGFIYESLGDTARAAKLFEQALALFRTLGIPTGEAYARHGLARVGIRVGNFREAQTQIEAAIGIVERLRAKVVSQDLRASYLASYQHLYSLHVDLLMQINVQQPAAGYDAAALQAAERARARSLLEVLTESRADIRQGVDATLLGRERELQRRLNGKEAARQQLLQRQPASAQVAAADREIRNLTTELQEVQAQIRLQSPRYAALTQPQPLTLAEIQRQVLDDETLLLEYALGEPRSYLWVVSSSSVRSFVLPGQRAIETAARKFYDALIAPNQSSRALQPAQQVDAMKVEAQTGDVGKAAETLSKLILEPAAALLGNKRLLIVADGALQYVPFAALPVVSGRGSGGGEKPRQPQEQRQQGGTTANPSTGASASQRPTTDHRPPTTDHRPLLADHEIVSLPSASTLAVLRREIADRPVAARTIAVIADPVFSAEDARVKRDMSGGDGAKGGASRQASKSPLAGAANKSAFQFQRLPGSRQEATEILSLVPEEQRRQSLDFEASRETATSPALAEYAMIHFATHGVLNSDTPELSGIVLSLFDEKGKPQDGFLRLHEIYNLRLPAELVVLSACQTGLGKQIRGEGLVGLTRGFMYAGAARVVASLWKVDDKATATLMKLFYQKMLGDAKLRPAAALREAQLELMRQRRWQSPYYWAAFTIQGEWR